MSLLRNADLATRSVVRSFGISRTALANDASPVKRIHKACYADNWYSYGSCNRWSQPNGYEPPMRKDV